MTYGAINIRLETQRPDELGRTLLLYVSKVIDGHEWKWGDLLHASAANDVIADMIKVGLGMCDRAAEKEKKP